jgi:uncharacterized protein with HEPN domain
MRDAYTHIEALAIDILTLIEGMSAEEFALSCLARAQILRRLGEITLIVGALPPAVLIRMPEIDWATWIAAREELAGVDGAARAWALASSELTPLLQWIRVYRSQGKA